MKSFFLIVLSFVYLSLSAQNSESGNIGLNDTKVPGSLLIEFGYNILTKDVPDTLNMAEIGSRTFRVGYQYELPIAKSAFTFNPGLAMSIEKYKFSNDETFIQNVDGTIGLTQFTGTGLARNFTKSLVSMTYLDLPLELRWHVDKGNYQKSFKIAVGFKVGLRMGASTKIKFDDAITGDARVIKDKQNYELRRFRYGAFGRVGMGSFGLYYQHSFSELFQQGKGPGATTATPIQVGLTYEIF